MSRFTLVFVLVSTVAISNVALADCNAIIGTTSCSGVCYDDDLLGADRVECDLSGEDDLLILAEDASGDAYAYGLLDADNVATAFCCNETDMGISSPGAVEVEVYGNSGADTICLHDAASGSCVGYQSSTQIWPAAGEIYGGTYDDHIETCPSGAYDDHVEGEAGEDTIDTFDGADVIYGGNNPDTLKGGDGDDELYGGADDVVDTMYGESGADTLEGGAGNDVMRGGSGVDTMRGQGGDDTMYGETGWDQMTGGEDDDTLYGDSGNDCLCGGDYGATQNDDGDPDNLYGNADSDTCYYVSSQDTVNCETETDGAACWCAP